MAYQTGAGVNNPGEDAIAQPMRKSTKTNLSNVDYDKLPPEAKVRLLEAQLAKVNATATASATGLVNEAKATQTEATAAVKETKAQKATIKGEAASTITSYEYAPGNTLRKAKFANGTFGPWEKNPDYVKASSFLPGSQAAASSPTGNGVAAPSGVFSGSGMTNSPLTQDGKPYTGQRFNLWYVNGFYMNAKEYAMQTGDYSYFAGNALWGPNATDPNNRPGGSNFTSGTSYANNIAGFGNNGGASAADAAAAVEKANIAQAAADEKRLQRESIIKIVTDRFAKYNLGSLAQKIRDLAIDGANEATIIIALSETKEYKERFAGNDARLKKGIAVLDPGSYLEAEDTYRQVLRANGLKQFDTDAYVQQFIENDTSSTEIASRISTAVNRIQYADPAIKKTLKDYYGLNDSDLLGYVLSPDQELPKIQQKITAAEIGTAASVQGLKSSLGVSEQLASQGVTQAEAQKGYANIASFLPTTEKLGNVYNELPGYNQADAEQETFNQLASAQRKRERLRQKEMGTFGASSGTNRGSSPSAKSAGQF